MFKSLRLILAFAVEFRPALVVSLSPERRRPPGAWSRSHHGDRDTLRHRGRTPGSGRRLRFGLSHQGLPKKRINALDPSVEGVLGICKQTASYPTTKPTSWSSL